MKKHIIFVLAICQAAIISAQTEFDAIRLYNHDISGTARYSAMAGAFSTLGGDVSAIKDNPAALGIFRKSEFSATLSTGQTSAATVWNNSIGSDDKINLNFNQLGFVLSKVTSNAKMGNNKGLLMSNWSFGYNRLKNFNRAIHMSSQYTSSSMTDYIAAFTGNLNGNYVYDDTNYEPFDNTDIPWISIMGAYGGLISEDASSGVSNWYSPLNSGEKVRPTYLLNESGYLDQMNFAWSGNYGNRLFLGLSLNINRYSYKMDSRYGEVFENDGSFEFQNSLSTSGTSMGISAGAIYAPFDFMRIGASVQSPTVFKMSDSNRSYLKFDIFDVGNITSPYGYNDYKLRTPLSGNVGVGFILGRFALIDLEYNITEVKSSRFSDLENSSIDYYNENVGFGDKFNNVQTAKLGAEIKLTDNFSLRGGYSFTTAIAKEDAIKVSISNTVRTDPEYFLHQGTTNFTAGFGYRESDWYLDFAFVKAETKESFHPYNSLLLNPDYAASPASVVTSTSNLLFTLGYKF